MIEARRQSPLEMIAGLQRTPCCCLDRCLKMEWSSEQGRWSMGGFPHGRSQLVSPLLNVGRESLLVVDPIQPGRAGISAPFPGGLEALWGEVLA